MLNTRAVCIIGAGASGIAAAAALSRAGVAFDCLEAGSQPGGLWRYGNDSGSSVYASLITNTARCNMEWFGYEIPGAPNDYLKHAQVLEYLTAFLTHAKLQESITTWTRVTKVEPAEQGGFRVEAEQRSGERLQREYASVVVANGRHSTPKWPDIPGLETAAAVLHACDYRTPEVFAGKNVIVVGFGASGVDIAADAAGVARSVTLSTRGGGILLPRYYDGKPGDAPPRPWLYRIPFPIRKRMRRMTLRNRPTSTKVRALLERDAAVFDRPAIISDRLSPLLEEDKVLVRPGIARVEKDLVVFEDGTRAECDTLVLATGYMTSYPFFPAELLRTTCGFADRYLRVLPPEAAGLYFAGQISVAGPYFRLFEAQARWIADLVSRRCLPPSANRLRRLAAHDSKIGQKRFPYATQPQDMVDYHSYMHALAREHAAGLRRAERRTVRGSTDRLRDAAL
ncbi:MAG TPA: NAD(P)-binding domain-containing protein [Bryobacteraceae bacterium]|jgi:cation diffusion facilitator CzcD-associated flavoprotein CzcO|nr:NAD(P)-binding domain-containing protein [Bryobacteraceae bacterium]